jgi:hypothetical protein
MEPAPQSTAASLINVTYTLLQAVPAVIWAAVIAAAIAAVTTILSNSNARRMLKMQLDHTRDQQEAQRKMQLRRDVYLPAIKAATSAPMILSDILDLEKPISSIQSTMKKISSELAGVHVIASEATLEAVTKYAAELSILVLGSMSMGINLRHKKSDVDAWSELITKEVDAGTRVTELMKEHNIYGGDPENFPRLQRQWDLHSRQLAQWEEKRALHTKELNEQLIEQLRQLPDKMAPLIPLQARALVQIRRELEMPLDENFYTELATSILDSMKRPTADAANEMESLARSQISL